MNISQECVALMTHRGRARSYSRLEVPPSRSNLQASRGRTRFGPSTVLPHSFCGTECMAEVPAWFHNGPQANSIVCTMLSRGGEGLMHHAVWSGGRVAVWKTVPRYSGKPKWRAAGRMDGTHGCDRHLEPIAYLVTPRRKNKTNNAEPFCICRALCVEMRPRRMGFLIPHS